MSQISIYLQLRYLGVLFKSIPAVLISILFVISVRTVDVNHVIDYQTMSCFFVMSFFEILPWLLSIFLYIYLLWLKRHGELELIENYRTSWLCWWSLLPVWITFSLMMLIYMGFLSPQAKEVLRSQSVLSGLELNQATPVYDGVIWLEQNQVDKCLEMNWWYQSGKHQAKLHVSRVQSKAQTLDLGKGHLLVKSPGQGLKLNFEQGDMLTSKVLEGSKYKSLKKCIETGQWGEIAFRLNHVFLVLLATALMHGLFQKFGPVSMLVFVMIVLCFYLPLWTHVKGVREEVGFFYALLPSYFLLGLQAVFAFRRKEALV